jgi:hypothetical protein
MMTDATTTFVIASEAKQSIVPRARKLDCFVACAPGNDDANNGAINALA